MSQFLMQHVFFPWELVTLVKLSMQITTLTLYFLLYKMMRLSYDSCEIHSLSAIQFNSLTQQEFFPADYALVVKISGSKSK